ncbi:DUF2756 domain-containing protein [Pantoea sp. BAV 3049]|uniref:DUF2756 domain-containing protein n=1 Tax=Pantoea sp. BAV 3049 TaxID=2654188 RepID=UPI00131D19C4|nr:DUF2756 domain-containing protein [Pantoea sp. BAV 3049]
MKWLMIFAALVPLSGMANMLNNSNDPDKPGYNPSTQRMQQQMQTQQSQQKLKLQQDQQRQSQDLQRKVQEQRDSASQRILQSQPGSNTQPPVQQNNSN